MRGPAASFTVLAERRRPEILAYLVRMLGNRDDAEDACQETFLRAHAAFGRLNADANARAWLYRIATNTALNLARGRTRRTSRLVESDPDTLAGAVGTGAEERADLRAVARVVGTLPPRQRAALMLRCFQELDYAEIAASVGGSAEAARWLETEEGRRELAAHRRALDALRELYGARTAERARAAAAAVHYTSLAAPIGRVLVAVGDAGLVRVSFRQSEASFVAGLERQLGVRAVRSPSETAEVVEQLRAYFAGRRRRFDVPVDLRHVTPFVRRVLTATMQVPAGNLVSYGDIARRIGQPKGSRAVGQALGRNPIPIVIPCHRVIAAGGRIGGYGGGLAIKRRLLRLEGALAAAS